MLFFGIVMKTDLLQSCGHCWVFQICWHVECSTFTASSFRIWNNSAGIPSPPLALFIVMLPKAHLTSHSRMSSSRWVTTALWLFGSLQSFLYSSSVYSCHLFLISFASVHCHFCPLLFPSLHEMLPWYLTFLEEISSLSHCIVFPYLFSFHCSVKKAFLSLLAFLWNSAFIGGISFPFPFAFCFSYLRLYLTNSVLCSPERKRKKKIIL